MSLSIIDLHCDLLAYLRANPRKNSPLDPVSNCSIPQLEAGNVRLQTLALWDETRPGSHNRLKEELAAYHQMLGDFSDRVAPLSEGNLEKKRVHFVLAVENASVLLEEGEPLALLEERLNQFVDPLLYASLTWNEENRFGGGNQTHVGLKQDGEVALELLAQKGIAVDLSHTSDALADGILNYIHKKGLPLQPLISHSNFRKVLNCPRNVPDMIAKEVAQMGGVIGMNFVRMFIGDQPEDFLKHLRYGIELVGTEALAIGGDFFGGIDLAQIAHLKPFFQAGFDTSACYPRFLKLLEKELSVDQIKKIAYQNAEKLLVRQGLILNQEVNDGTPTP